MLIPAAGAVHVRRFSLVLVVGLVAALLLAAGCGSVPVQRPYTREELARECVRTGGWWRPQIAEGFCEYQMPGWGM